MTQGGEALEWALALQQAPSRRAVVRAQPLPTDITELLSIAGGSVASLESAARRIGATEPAVLDAARFFVQQAMLFDGADAYRVLGVARNADAALIRDHHRLLLRWLHPDRSRGGQWDSAFSGRVNWAWNLLRTDAARAAYDSTLESATPPVPASVDVAPARWRDGARAAHAIGPGGRIGPLSVLLVTLACIALAWLVMRRESELDRLRDADLGPVARVVPAPAQAGNGAGTAPPQGLDAVRRAASALALASAPVRNSDPKPAPRADGPEAIAVGTAAVVATDPVAAAGGPDADGDGIGTAAGVGAQASGPLATPQSMTATPRTARPPPEPFNRRATAAPERRIALSWSQAGVNPATRPIAPASSAARAAYAPVDAPDLSVPSRAPTLPAVRIAPDPPMAAGTAPDAMAPGAEADPLQLMRQAQARVRGVTRYLLADAPSPPWTDAAAGGAGDGIRSDLQARLAGGQARELQLVAPRWRLDAQSATLRSAYAVAGPDGPVEQGELAIELARRDDQWQVASLRLAPAP